MLASAIEPKKARCFSPRSLTVALALHLIIPLLFASLYFESSKFAVTPGEHSVAMTHTNTSATAIDVELMPPSSPPVLPVVAPEPAAIEEAIKPIPKPVDPQVQKKHKPVRAVQPTQAVPLESKVSDSPQPDAATTTSSIASQGAESATPDYLNNPPPLYPREARLAEDEGVVTLLVSLNSEGAVANVQLSKSSHSRSLDAAAITAVEKWRFKPAKFAGVPIASQVVVPIRFRLNS